MDLEQTATDTVRVKYINVLVPQIWEAIIVEEDGKEVIEHVLLNRKTSDYIRSLEKQLATTKQLLADKLQEKKS